MMDSSQYLTFHLAGEEYAVGILRVREIVALDTLTKVPRMPPHIRGVINLRGSVVPLVDLAARFGLPPTALGPRTCVVILEMQSASEAATVGFLADSVGEVIELASKDILPTPRFGTPVNINFLQGMARISNKFILILDIDTVVSEPAGAEASFAHNESAAGN
jgi:purine-binding chemotaxis protein CheW